MSTYRIGEIAHHDLDEIWNYIARRIVSLIS